MLLAFDYAAKNTRRFDLDGRLHTRAVLTKACVSEYLGREVPDYAKLGLQADTLYPLLRDPDALAKALGSFNALPILMRHVAVNADEPHQWDVVGSTGTDAAFDGIEVTNALVIWTSEAISLIESGKQRDLSVGYRYRCQPEAGVFNGQRFIGRMVEISANHLALVSNGRVSGAQIPGNDSAGCVRDLAAAQHAPGILKVGLGYPPVNY